VACLGAASSLLSCLFCSLVPLAQVKHIIRGYAILAKSFGLAPHGGMHMPFVKGKPPETQYATRPGARAK
jgi:hypothetical protein